MATAAARAIQRAPALERLTKATKKLAKAYGVDAPDFPMSHRDPAYLPTVQMEVMADFLESLAGADTASEQAADEMEKRPAAKGGAKPKAAKPKADA